MSIPNRPSDRSESRDRALADLIDDGLAIVEVQFGAAEPSYRLVEANRAFEQQTGLDGVDETSPPERLPALDQRWVDACASVARSGQPEQFEQHEPSSDRWLSIKVVRLGATPEPIVGILSRDVTARRRDEALRRESEERLRIALEAADLATWDMDLRSGSETTRSPRHDRMYGYAEAQPDWNLDLALRHVVEEDRQVVTDAMAQAARSGRIRAEMRVRWPDGSLHWLESTGRTYYDERGVPVRMAGVVADVTARKMAEHALRDSDTLFRTMADTVPIIVWTTDGDGRADFFNREWTLYTGVVFEPRTVAEVAVSHVHPEDVAVTLERFEQARRNGTRFAVEHRIRATSGEYRWFQVQADPYRDPETGQVLRWFGTSVDIHDTREAARILRDTAASQAFQLELFEAIRTLDSPDAIIDATSRMLGERLNASRVVYCETTGPNAVVVRRDWSADQRISFAGAELTLSDFGAGLIDELRAGRVVVNHDVVVDPRTAGHIDAFSALGFRSQLAVPVLRNGQLKLVLAIHRAQPSQWGDAEIQLAQAVSQQILLAAEAATVEGELRAERDLSRAIFDSMEEGFALIGPDWTILDINEIGARIAGLSRSEMIGRDHWQVLPETRDSPLEQIYRRVQATGAYETFEYLHGPPGGEPHWVEIRTYRIETGALVAFFRDISQRKRIEQELNDAVRRRDEFLAMLAHELRNPLAPIRAAADVLSHTSLDAARIRKTSAIISRQVKHMTSLVDDLLDVSRVTRGLAVLEKERVDLKWAASSAVEQVRPLMEARRHHLTVQTPPGNADVSGDPKRLVQVLTNLLNNAAKYTPEGGRVALAVQVDDEYVSISVADNGIGMSPEMSRRAFTLFSQAEQTSDRSQGGLGIGLALVKSLVELHGGSVSATSAGAGAGSEFTVCLPRSSGASKPADEAATSTPASRPGTLRVLIVDDNQDAASMLEMYLEVSGHTVMTEHGSRQGLERALAEKPDICLLDIGLPDMDGNELARRIRSSPEIAHAVLIAVTGYGQESDRQSTAAAGFDHHLVKPVDPLVLTKLLETVSTR